MTDERCCNTEAVRGVRLWLVGPREITLMTQLFHHLTLPYSNYRAGGRLLKQVQMRLQFSFVNSLAVYCAFFVMV